MPRTLSAQEAADRLGVSRATLYAYVSRGLVRSEPGGEGRRDRRYLGEDVEKLTRRRDDRRDPTRAVQEALHWGSPLLESALTLIEDGRLYYRGRDVAELAGSGALEEVAILLWTGDDPATPGEPPSSHADLFVRLPDAPDVTADTPAEGYAVALARAAAHDL
ncbi:helix-turn-helix domain-containing protein, partial [Deinococcus pimensis]|uniref:helix-turn-helix domain-containing protein n=1 Tax=Deinococcus pimensis TaxID=309888 RepID=UPI0005EB819A